MKAILTLLTVLSSLLILLGVSSYRAGNGLGFVLILGGSVMTTALLTIWILAAVRDRREKARKYSDDFS